MCLVLKTSLFLIPIPLFSLIAVVSRLYSFGQCLIWLFFLTLQVPEFIFCLVLTQHYTACLVTASKLNDSPWRWCGESRNPSSLNDWPQNIDFFGCFHSEEVISEASAVFLFWCCTLTYGSWGQAWGINRRPHLKAPSPSVSRNSLPGWVCWWSDGWAIRDRYGIGGTKRRECWMEKMLIT